MIPLVPNAPNAHSQWQEAGQWLPGSRVGQEGEITKGHDGPFGVTDTLTVLLLEHTHVKTYQSVYFN